MQYQRTVPCMYNLCFGNVCGNRNNLHGSSQSHNLKTEVWIAGLLLSISIYDIKYNDLSSAPASDGCELCEIISSSDCFQFSAT